MTLPIVLAPEAEDDLHDAAAWYDTQQPGLGDAFLRSALLHRFPYAVRFRAQERRIEVIAVWHGWRDPEGWKTRVGAEPR